MLPRKSQVAEELLEFCNFSRGVRDNLKLHLKRLGVHPLPSPGVASDQFEQLRDRARRLDRELA